MKRAGKLAIGVAISLIALLVVVVVVAVFRLGTVIKTGVEMAGPKLTGTTVKLSEAVVRPLRGYARLNGLVIGNPPGYDAPSAIELGELKIDMAVASVLTDTIRIRSVLIDGPQITIEGSPVRNNLTDIKKHLESVGSGSKDPEASGTGTEPPAEASKDRPETQPGKAPPAKKVVIDELVVRNGTIKFGTLLTLPLPEIRLTDIGKEQDTTLIETVQMVIGEVLKASLGAFSGAFDLTGKGLKQLGTGGKDAATAIGNALGAGGEAAGQELKKIGKELGGLLKKDNGQ